MTVDITVDSTNNYFGQTKPISPNEYTITYRFYFGEDHTAEGLWSEKSFTYDLEDPCKYPRRTHSLDVGTLGYTITDSAQSYKPRALWTITPSFCRVKVTINPENYSPRL